MKNKERLAVKNEELIDALNRLEDKIDKRLDRLDVKIDTMNDNLTKFKINASIILGGLITGWELIKRKMGL